MLLGGLLAACAQPAPLERGSSEQASFDARAAVIGLPVATRVDEPNSSQRRCVTQMHTRELKGDTCTLDVEGPARMIRVAEFATPIASPQPPLVRDANAMEPERSRPLPECIRLSTSPAGADEPGVAQHLAFRNVCPTRISLWHCDQRGCPRMTAHAFIEPGATSTHATRKGGNPSPGGGDFVACPSPKADYVRKDGDWVCTRSP